MAERELGTVHPSSRWIADRDVGARFESASNRRLQMSAEHTSGRDRAPQGVRARSSLRTGGRLFDERLLPQAEANDGCERLALLYRVVRAFTRALPPGYGTTSGVSRRRALVLANPDTSSAPLALSVNLGVARRRDSCPPGRPTSVTPNVGSKGTRLGGADSATWDARRRSDLVNAPPGAAEQSSLCARGVSRAAR